MSKNFELMQGARLHLDSAGSAGVLPANPAGRLQQDASQLPKARKTPPSFASRWLRKEFFQPVSQTNLVEASTLPYLACFDDDARAESTKLVRSVFPRTLDDPHRVVVFAGIDSSNSCAWICTHAADTLANRKGKTVCVVDANLSASLLPHLFGVTDHCGLTDALDNVTPIREFAIWLRPNNVCFLSSGSLAHQSRNVMNSDPMRLRVSELRKEFDYVLLHCSPLPKHDDAMSLARWADGLVLVLDINSPCRELAAIATQRLRAANIKILGAVLNKRSFPQPATVYRDS